MNATLLCFAGFFLAYSVYFVVAAKYDQQQQRRRRKEERMLRG